MDLLDWIIPGLAAAIAAMSEFLKGWIGKIFPNWTVKNQVITIIGAVVVIAAYYFIQKPDLGTLLQTGLLALLASSGIYGFIIKPAKKAGE